MRLTKADKEVVLAKQPGAALVRVGKAWALVWFDEEQARAERWRGVLVSAVVEGVVWFDGSEIGARTRRSVIQQLGGAE